MKRRSRAFSSRSGKITASSRATRAGSIRSRVCTYSAWVSMLVARIRPLRSTISARPASISVPAEAVRGSIGSEAAIVPIRAPIRVKAPKKHKARITRRTWAEPRDLSRMTSWRRRRFSRSMLSGFSPLWRACRMRASGRRGVRVMAFALHLSRQACQTPFPRPQSAGW